MAEFLLKGHKMLSNSCPDCGNPVFDVRGETLCVVCREKGTNERSESLNSAGPGQKEEKDERRSSETIPELSEALTTTLINLCRKIDTCEDSERCSRLMETVKTGIEALLKIY